MHTTDRRPAGPVKGGRILPVTHDDRDSSRAAASVDRIDDGLEVRPATRGEDAEDQGRGSHRAVILPQAHAPDASGIDAVGCFDGRIPYDYR
jgi:hypothetical protein